MNRIVGSAFEKLATLHTNELARLFVGCAGNAYGIYFHDMLWVNKS